jgi:hypothetical protein
MDWKTFTIGILEAVNWPIFILIIALSFKTQLERLLDRVSTLSHKDTVLQFSNELKSVKKISKNIEIDGQETTEPETFSLTELTEYSPQSAILMAWLQVEKVLIDKLKELKIAEGENRMFSARSRIERLHEKELISKNHISFFNNLSKLRNEAAHNPNMIITQDDALKYLKYIDELITLINNIQ